jgi:hypothetical protein
MAHYPVRRPASDRSAGFGLDRSQIKGMAASRLTTKPRWPTRVACQEMGKPDGLQGMTWREFLDRDHLAS